MGWLQKGLWSLKLVFIQWKRLVATLCVALAAFLSVEPALEDHSGQYLVQTIAYDLAEVEIAAADQAGVISDQQGLPSTGSSHHCCAAHITSMPSIIVTLPMRPRVLEDNVPFAHVHAPQIYTAGPERPPRQSALS